jgi:hypothetical protein
MDAATRRAMTKLAEAHGLTVKVRGNDSEVLLVTDLGHARVNRAYAACTAKGEWIAARYRTDRNEWQSRRGSAGSLEELIARGVKTYTSALACLRAQLPSQR